LKSIYPPVSKRPCFVCHRLRRFHPEVHEADAARQIPTGAQTQRGDPGAGRGRRAPHTRYHRGQGLGAVMEYTSVHGRVCGPEFIRFYGLECVIGNTSVGSWQGLWA